jgi:CBS domain-containing protein
LRAARLEKEYPTLFPYVWEENIRPPLDPNPCWLAGSLLTFVLREGTRSRALEGSGPMRIEAWMNRPVLTVKPRDSARHAREMMEKHRINQLPVVVGGLLVGIVTDRDLRDVYPSVFESAEPVKRHMRGMHADPATIHIEDVMTSAVVTLAPAAFVADAARLMRRDRFGAIPVVENGRLVGILTRSDVLEAFVELSQGALPSG